MNDATFDTDALRVERRQVAGIVFPASTGRPARSASSGMPSTNCSSRMSVSRCSGRQGATVKPQLPMTTVVTPCHGDGLADGSQNSWQS